MEAHQLYTLKRLEKDLGRKLSDADRERAESFLERTAKEHGEVISPEDARSLDERLTMVQARYALPTDIFNRLVKELSQSPTQDTKREVHTINPLPYVTFFLGIGVGSVLTTSTLMYLDAETHQAQMEMLPVPVEKRESILGPHHNPDTSMYEYKGKVLDVTDPQRLESFPEIRFVGSDNKIYNLNVSGLEEVQACYLKQIHERDTIEVHQITPVRANRINFYTFPGYEGRLIVNDKDIVGCLK